MLRRTCNGALVVAQTMSFHSIRNLGGSEAPIWRKHKETVRSRLGGATWNPPKKLSREQMDAVRMLKASVRGISASDLAERFRVSPEAIRRILRSRWRPSDREQDDIQDRWHRRGERIKALNGDRQSVSAEPRNPPILPLRTVRIGHTGHKIVPRRRKSTEQDARLQSLSKIKD